MGNLQSSQHPPQTLPPSQERGGIPSRLGSPLARPQESSSGHGLTLALVEWGKAAELLLLL